MNLGSLLRGVAGARRGTRTTTTGTGMGTTPYPSGGGLGETIGRAVDGQAGGGRRGVGAGAGGLGGMLRRFTGGTRH